MSLVANLELILDSVIENLDPIRLGPAQFTMTAGDASLNVKTLVADEFHTILSDAVVEEMSGPYRWLIINIHETTNAKIGFGQATPIVLEPNEFAFWNGPDLPYAAGDGAAGQIVYWVINKT